MRGTKSIERRLLAVLMCLAMLFSYLPGMALDAAAAEDPRTVDPHTLDQWQNYFGVMDGSYNNVKLTTEYAGGVWTDKSVFSPAQLPSQLTGATYNNKSFAVADEGDNFIVSLSAIASNKEMVGYSTIPTDTVFVLDLSSSMRSNDDAGGSAIDELVDATNKAIKDLLDLNKNNRVAVVLFAGNDSGEFNDNDGITSVILPMDTYQAGTAGVYLRSVSSGYNANWAVEVASGVRGSNGTVTGRLDTSRGTFTQDGIYEAMRVLLGVTDTKVQEGVQAGTTRLPIMVLMTDGEPTLGNRDYNGNDARTDLGTSEIYLKFNNQDYNHRDTIAWLTQLTAAYAKREVSQHYENNALFYTLAFGEESTRLEEALSVVNPAETSTTLNGFWEDFLNGDPVNVYTYTQNRRTYYYTTSNDTNEPLTAADKVYVDKYFPAENDQDLFDAFEDIVDEIIVQSKYYPTYVEKDINHDGYLTFVDKIGEYMEVTDVKGIIIGNRLFSGEALASKLITGGFGAVQNPDAEGKVLIRSIMTRLGITDMSEAQALLQSAIDKGQLSYNAQTREFSQYIGWYADAEGNFIDFWHEGMTDAQKPGTATHIIRSYGFLGDTTVVPGVAAADMMYMTVRVTTEIATGKDMITWRIPASLVPTVTYDVEVEVNSDGRITNLTGLSLSSDSAQSPIRLVYEVAMEEDIHDWNLAERIADSYVDENGYVFYSNRWSAEAEDTTLNTYSHFEPSVENERYYYTQENTVLVKNGDTYTPYTGSKPSGTGYYHAYQCFELLTDNSLRMHYHYEPISSDAMEEVKADGSQWVIPKGVVHRYYDYEITEKRANDTRTMGHSDHPFIVKTGDHYYTYSTQGNNGLLTMTPATGIRLTKALAEGYTTDASFTFQLAGDISQAQVVRLNEAGDEASRAALAASGRFTLQAGETVYIVGLTNSSYTVSEVIPSGADYAVSQVKVNGAPITGADATVTLTAQQIVPVEFTNDEVGYGNVYVTKELASDHTIPATVADQLFEVEAFVGTALTGDTYKVAYVDDTGRYEVDATVDASGYLRLAGGQNAFIHQTQTYEILGLPEGTQVQIRENLSAQQDTYFDATIKTRDHTGADQDDDNTVTVYKNANATAVITNTYKPVKATVDLDISGTKNFQVDTPLTGDVTFTFAVQQPVGTGWEDIATKTASVTYGSADGTGTLIKNFRIDDVLAGIEYTTVGTHTYQVVEKIPTNRAPGVTYDRSLYTFTVSVEDREGTLVAQVTDYRDNVLGSTYDVSFTNNYNTAPVSLDVTKTVENKANNPEAAANAPFTFVVTATNSSFQQNGHTYARTIHGEGAVRFTNNLNTAGEYFATVHEQIPAGATLVTGGEYDGMYTLNGWYYDPAVWYLHILVEDVGGDLQAVVKAGTDPNNLSGTEDSVELLFHNIYAPQETTVDLNAAVFKELTGRDLQPNEFTFYVTENNDHSNILLTGTNDAQGNVTFQGSLPFGAIGHYAYDVVENQENQGGITYDKTVYDMVVEVTDNGDGTLKAIYYFEDSIDNKVTFRNTYTTSGTEHVIAGSKTLTGRPMLNGEFTFLLEEATDEQGTLKQNGLKLEAENGPATGNVAAFVFPKIPYTAAGTYYYKITEVQGAQGMGVTYSTDSYVYQVVIADNGQGEMIVESADIVNYNGVTTDLPTAISFVNTYKAQKTQTTIESFKELTGKVLGDGEFRFVMTETESDFETLVAGGYTETVTNNENGTLLFGGEAGKKLEFEEEDTRYYVIREDASAAAGGIVYDTSEFLVTITAVDNHQGKLDITTSIQKKTVVEEEGQITEIIQPVSSIIFYNRYEPDPVSYAPIVRKLYEGDAMKTFDFVLTGEGFQPQTKQNDADGYVYFDALTFPAAGTYTFTIREQENALWGFIKWDTNVYTLTVKVKDEGFGQLEIDGSITITSTTGRNDLVFRNVHEDLVLTKDVALDTAPAVSIDGQQARQGDVLVYTIRYTNYTTENVDVTITDTIPAYTEYVTGSATEGGSFAAGKLTWDLTGVAPDETVTVSFKVKVTGTKGTVENQAQVLEGTNLYDSNTVTTGLPGEADLTIGKTQAVGSGKATADKLTVEAGDEVTYILTVTNSGDGDAAGVTVSDKIPEGLTFVSADNGGQLLGSTVTWTVDTIKAGESAVVSFKVKVPAVQQDTKWENIATFTYGDEPAQESNKVEIQRKVPVTPETGDNFHASVFVALMILSSFGLAAVVICKKREEAREEA